MIKLTR
jgi:hypothetical protein